MKSILSTRLEDTQKSDTVVEDKKDTETKTGRSVRNRHGYAARPHLNMQETERHAEDRQRGGAGAGADAA